MTDARPACAVVTGAGSGIGRALALAAADRGMELALCDRDEAALTETAALASKRGAAVLSQVFDVTDASAVGAFAGRVAQECAPVSLTFANAGILRMGPLRDTSIAAVRQMFEVNVIGALNVAQAFLPLLEQGGAGTLVITGSTGSFAAYPGLGAYCASKHAVWALSESLSAELAETGSTTKVSLFVPGAVATGIFDADAPDRPESPDAIPAHEAARIAFAGIAAGDRIIPTHPASSQAIADRFGQAATDLARDYPEV